MVTKLRLVETREEALNRLARLAQKRAIRVLTYPLTGERFALSLSHPETVHRVNRLGCDCLGFTYHNRCTHYAALLESLGELPPERPGSPAAPAQAAVPVVLCDACDEVMAHVNGVAFECACGGLYEIDWETADEIDVALAELSQRRDGEIVTVAGIVSAVKQLTTKKGDPMVFLRLDDVVGSAEVVVFNSVYAASRELLAADEVLVVKARVDHKEGESKLIALEVTAFEATPERREVRLKLDATRARAGIIRELAAVVRDFPGEAPVVIDLITSEGPRTFQFGTDYRVKPEPDFFAEVKALLGEAAVA